MLKQSADFLLVLASTVILGSDFPGTYDHILVSDGSGSVQLNLGAKALHIIFNIRLTSTALRHKRDRFLLGRSLLVAK
jgi:hypothetical protein